MTQRECPDFRCAICQREKSNRWPGPFNLWPIYPLCRYCEETWGKPTGAAGAFRDRRVARQIDALSTALSAKSHQALYNPARFNRARP